MSFTELYVCLTIIEIVIIAVCIIKDVRSDKFGKSNAVPFVIIMVSLSVLLILSPLIIHHAIWQYGTEINSQKYECIEIEKPKVKYKVDDEIREIYIKKADTIYDKNADNNYVRIVKNKWWIFTDERVQLIVKE